MRKLCILSFLAITAMLLAIGCASPVSSTANVSTSTSEPNQVTATVTGVILDGFGYPVRDVTVTYDDGIGSKAIKNGSTNDKGYFEIVISNPGGDYASTVANSKYIVTLSKTGWTTKRITVEVPTIKTIRTNLGVGTAGDAEKPVTGTITTTTGTGATTTATVTNTSALYKGWLVSLNLPVHNIYELSAQLKGTLMVQRTASAEAAPVASSMVAFYLSSDYTPYRYTTTTDASGIFAFATARTDSVEGNLLPAFGPNVISGVTNDILTSAKLYVYIPKGTGTKGDITSDSSGMNMREVTLPAGFALESFAKTAAARDIGTQYVVAELKPAVLSSSLVNLIGTSTTDYSTSIAAPATVVVKFNKPMNDTLISSDNVVITGSVVSPASTTGSEYYRPTLTWDTTKTALTITPKVAFQKGAAITIKLVNFVDSEGAVLTDPAGASAFNTWVAGVTFYVKDGIRFLTASFLDSYGAGKKVGVSDTVSATFNADIASFDANLTYLYNTTTAATVPCAIAKSSTDAKTLVFTPGSPLILGNGYKVFYKVFSTSSTTDYNDIAVDGGTLTFTVSDMVKPFLVKTNVLKNSGSNILNPEDLYDVTKPISLEFASALYVGTPDVNVWTLTQGGANVEKTVAYDTAKKVVTITPVASLLKGRSYVLVFTVYGSSDVLNVTGPVTITFTTAKDTLAATTFALDSVRQAANLPTGYNYGSGITGSPLYALTSKVTNADGVRFEYSYASDATQTWRAFGTATPTTVDNVSGSYLVSIAMAADTIFKGVVSGDTLKVRAFATDSTNTYKESVASGVLSFADTVAPARNLIVINSGSQWGGAADNATATQSTTSQFASSTTQDNYYTFSVASNPAANTEERVLTLSGGLSQAGQNSVVTSSYTQGTGWTIYVKVPKNTTVSTATGSIKFAITDKAGNAVDFGVTPNVYTWTLVP